MSLFAVKYFVVSLAIAALAVGFVSVNTAEASAALTGSQIQAVVFLLLSFGADPATIANVEASLNGRPISGANSDAVASSCAFTRDMAVGVLGDDVSCLQSALLAAGYSLPVGATGYFGSQTKTAVVVWQKAVGVSPALGYFGSISRARWNLASPNVPLSSIGDGLTVLPGIEPASSLAPEGASRVPFTRFTLSAGPNSDVTVDGVTIQRVGSSTDADFSGVVLMDESAGIQRGDAKTLNGSHQATIGGTLTIPKGTTRFFLVAGAMAASLNAGETPQISVVAVNTTANVSGSLPITGTAQRTDTALAIGSVSTSTAAHTTGAAGVAHSGDRGVVFSSMTFTADSEDLKLYSMRWREIGSASSTDVANVMTVVNGAAYAASLDAGAYYTTTFPGGILIKRGASADVSLRGDIVGASASSSSRTIDFAINQNTDVYFVGQLYGYGIAPSGAYAPWYNGSVIIIY